MSFKIDTKEKFTIITPQTTIFDTKMAEALWEAATLRIHEEYGNVIVNMQNIRTSDADAVNNLASLQQHFHAANKSFVLCIMQPEIIIIVKNEDLIDGLNMTPSLSEAFDIVQMEEIERDLMGDFDEKVDELNG